MNIRTYIGLVLLALVFVFLVQNTSIVDIRFLFWKITMSRSLMILTVLTVGIFVGWILAGYFHRQRDKDIPADPQP